MAEFQEVMRQWKRLCDSDNTIPPYECTLTALKNSPDVFEKSIMEWSKKHPELVYPTWREYLTGLYFIDGTGDGIGDYSTFMMAQNVPADIAQKLGIEPVKQI